MNEQWLLHILVFIFGYVTCRTFYFLGSVRTSAKIVQFAQTIGLFIIARGLENLEWSRQYRINLMKENDASEHNVKAFKLHHDEEVRLYKYNSVQGIIELTGDFFSPVTQFSDWRSAMAHIDSNKEELFKFLRRD
jgi:hypothetical protein